MVAPGAGFQAWAPMDSRLRGNDETEVKIKSWPSFRETDCNQIDLSRPVSSFRRHVWIPAFAGMTKKV
jgi:hypothetical protein